MKFTLSIRWSVLICWLGAVASAPGQTPDIPIALFYDSVYVDTTTEINIHGGAGEALNLKTSLEMHGHTVSTFEGVDADDFSTALGTNDILAIPELDMDLTAAIDSDAAVVLADFVCHGGGLIIMGSPFATDFLKDVFGFDAGGFEQPTVTFLNDEEPLLPPRFLDGPETLNDPSLTWGMVDRRLPPNAVTIYGNGRNATVVTFTFGSGHVLFLGYDWFGTRPEGWETVLSLAVLHANDTEATPDNEHITVTTLSDEEDGGDSRSVAFLLDNPGTNGVSLREAIEATSNSPCHNVIGFATSSAIGPLYWMAPSSWTRAVALRFNLPEIRWRA